jgi:hypothetical protein
MNMAEAVGVRPNSRRSRVGFLQRRRIVMLAVGCLLPLVLMIAGAAVGGIVGGSHDTIWGGLAGAIIGTAGMLALVWGFEKIRSRGL